MDINIGLSIVREGRELELDSRWIPKNQKNPLHRWWGAEIEFGRGMDEIFGVTNNKQHAHYLSEMVSKEYTDFNFETLERLTNEDFQNYVLLQISQILKNKINDLFEKVEATMPKRKEKGSDDGQRHASTEKKATSATEERKKRGLKGDSDKYDDQSPEEKRRVLKEKLKDRGYSKKEIDEITGEVIDLGLKYVFRKRKIDTDAFFSVESESGILMIVLNTDHDAYNKLFGILESLETVEEGYNINDLNNKIEKAHNSIKILLEAWARMEDEATFSEKGKLKESRRLWGKIAKEFSTYGEEL